MLKPIITTLLVSTSLSFATLQQDLSSGSFDKVINDHQAQSSNQATFSIAVAQLAKSLETLQRELYTYGFAVNSTTAGIRNVSPLPKNPKPKAIDYPTFRKIFVNLHTDLLQLEKTLDEVNDDEFHMPLDLTKVRFDINNDGKYSEDESSLALFLNVAEQAPNAAQMEELAKFDSTIVYDKSDLLWLKGYTQVLLGATNMLLAHDFQAPFDTFAPHLFPKIESNQHPAIVESVRYDDIADLIAMLHSAKMPVIEPDRLKQSRLNLLAMVNCSKEMWRSVISETDNNREWLPSPKQDSVTGIQITQEMVDDWHKFLDEYEAILHGKKLIPHWRFKDRGINLKLVLDESKETDFVLWVTGHAAVPYIEKGELTDQNLWRQLNRTFGGNFLGMSFFIN